MKHALIAVSMLIAGFLFGAESRYDAFKLKLMPQIEKEVTIAGHLSAGKLGWWLAFDGWGAYIYPKARTREAMRMQNNLNQYCEKEVMITGRLHFSPVVIPPEGQIMSGIPEHFYFDPTECKVVENKTPNQALLPTPMSVTDRADARSAPDTGAADL